MAEVPTVPGIREETEQGISAVGQPATDGKATATSIPAASDPDLFLAFVCAVGKCLYRLAWVEK